MRYAALVRYQLSYPQPAGSGLAHQAAVRTATLYRLRVGFFAGGGAAGGGSSARRGGAGDHVVRISPSASLEVVRDEVVLGIGSNSASGSRLTRERAGLASGFAAGWALATGRVFAAGWVFATGRVFAAGWDLTAASGSLRTMGVSDSGGTRKS